MSGITASNKKKGYTTLQDGGGVALAFKSDMTKDCSALDSVVWFDTGLKMSDGTPRTIGACDKAQYDEYTKKGFKPVGGEVKEEKGSIVNLLDSSIPEIEDILRFRTDEELKTLLKAEQDGKTRKGVVTAIKDTMKENDAKKR